MKWSRRIRKLELLVLLALLLVGIAPEWPAFEEEEYRLEALVGLRQFDFLVWQGEAMLAKAQTVLTQDHLLLDEPTRQQVVLDYLDLMAQIGQLNRELDLVYSDPEVADPDAASQALQAELAQKRQALAAIQSLAEAILQDQVTQALTTADFSVLGQPWPPVFMHMTPTPWLLIVSPRDRIERVYQIALVHGLPVPEQEALETAVFQQLNLSALVVPIGGLGTYPSMITETSSVNWLAEVVAHEWGHVWLGFAPVSRNYSLDPQVRIINETAVSIFGKEIGNQVIAQYYPEFVPLPPENPPTATPAPQEPPAFDFRAEMAQTRVQADQLLAEGKIEEAEAYMEARRLLFWENGYRIRKINQAYFAFHGAYADQAGAAGIDPIGPLVRQIRAQSPTLHGFMETMRSVGSFGELQATAGERSEIR